LIQQPKVPEMSYTNLENETLISITDAAKRCPSRPHVGTVWRWTLNGLHGIKLQSIKVGGKRFTSLEALHRFIDATTARSAGKPQPVRTRRERQNAVIQAERILLSEDV
jgi:hypothetical protein